MSRTKRIGTKYEKKKANINYCKEYKKNKKNKEAYRKVDRERKKLTRENLKYLQPKK